MRPLWVPRGSCAVPRGPKNGESESKTKDFENERWRKLIENERNPKRKTPAKAKTKTRPKRIEHDRSRKREAPLTENITYMLETIKHHIECFRNHLKPPFNRLGARGLGCPGPMEHGALDARVVQGARRP